MEVFADSEPDAEFARGARRHLDRFDLTGTHAVHLHRGAWLKPADSRELGVEGELLLEQHAPLTDQEQPDREQEDAADDERADAGKPGWGHLVLVRINGASSSVCRAEALPHIPSRLHGE